MFGRDNSAAMDIAGVDSEAAGKSGAEFRQHGSEQDIELVLLASAVAIQRLIAERNTLRVRVEAQERELNLEALELQRKAREAESKAAALDPKETR